MWNKPWTYSEGSAIVAGLLIVGAMLQLTIGPVNWNLMAWPVNIIIAMVLTGAIIIGNVLRRRSYILRFASSRHAAVPVLLVAAVATAIYGVTNIRETLSFWPFVLLYLWMDIIVGMVTLKHIKPTLSNLCMTTSHAGLFIAITAGTLGNADMQRLKMQIGSEQPEWRAIDDDGKVHELPLAIQLNHFTIDEYPPKLVVIDNETGKTLPPDKPHALVLEDSITEGDILGYHIKTQRLYDYAAEVATKDTVNYVAWGYNGATTAALVSVTANGKTIVPAGWVSNGSFMFPYKAIRLNDKHSLVMPEREPKRYASDVTVYTKNGRKEQAVIEVNKPFDIEGWKIYQLSYDEMMGRWSTTSVLELVSDPWLPAVYTGIALLALGAIIMFLTAGRKEGE